MSQEKKEIKEKLRKILNSEITKTFFDNITKPLGDRTKRCNVISRQDSINCFLDNVFMNADVVDNNIFVEDLYDNTKINNLIIDRKIINIKTLSYKSNSISFNSFSFRESDKFNIDFHLENTLDKLKFFNYFLFIVIFRNEKTKVKYDFYLKPTTGFYFNPKKFHKTLSGFGGENWIIKSNREFAFLINKDNLGNPIYSYNC